MSRSNQPVRSAKPGWKQNPAEVRSDILRVSREEFAARGYSGARVDDIAARTRTSKRMIYYYFGDKEGLYRQVLEDAYRETRDGEQRLRIDDLAPEDALRQLIEFTFDHHRSNPDLVRLIMIENIHHGRYLAGLDAIKDLNRTALDKLRRICRQGRKAGTFRGDVTPIQLHWMISALCFFNISNQATFSMVFGGRLHTNGGQRRVRDQVVDVVLRYVVADPS